VFCAALLLLRKTGAPPSGRLNLTPEKKVLGSCRKVMIKYAIMKTKKDLDGKSLYGPGKDLWKGEDVQEFVDCLREGRTRCAKTVRNKRKPKLIQ
jgi:hypothetical protein